MELNIYSIYDSAAKSYATPFFMPNDGLAIRAFSDNANDGESVISKHPDQFVLYKIGQYNDQTAKLDHYDPLVNLGIAATFKTETPEQSELMAIQRYLQQIAEKIELDVHIKQPLKTVDQMRKLK